MEKDHAPSNVSTRRLWFGVAAGGTAWALHGLIVTIVCSQACKFGSGALFNMGPNGVRALLGMVTLVLFAVVLAGGLTAWRSWRATSGQAALLGDQAVGRADFMAVIGLFASAAFALGVIWAGVPVIFVSLCANAH